MDLKLDFQISLKILYADFCGFILKYSGYNFKVGFKDGPSVTKWIHFLSILFILFDLVNFDEVRGESFYSRIDNATAFSTS